MTARAPWSARLRSQLLAEQWRIGVIDAPIGSLLNKPRVAPQVQWLSPPQFRSWWADPFAHPLDPSLVYAERFDEDQERGWIECLAMEGPALVSRGEVLARGAQGEFGPLGKGRHASFPHAFEYEGRALAIAETAGAEELRLYSIDTPTRWTDEGALLSDVCAADPAIFRHEDRFWLAYTDARQGLYDHLLLLHASDLHGPWTPHPCNPVAQGLSGSRMAGGFFEHEGVLYRPGQDCDGGYGLAVLVFRVDCCTPKEYRETLVARIEPDPSGAAPAGLHTLNTLGARTLVDGKRWIVNPRVLRRKAARRLGHRSV